MSRAGGGLRIVESLENHGEAIGALLFSTFCIAMMFFPSIASVRSSSDCSFLFLGVPLLVSYLVVAPLVVDGNWRRTILDIGDERIFVRMISPLRRERQLIWERSAWRSVQLLRRANQTYEIELDMNGQSVRLFPGHTITGLADVDRAMRSELAKNAQTPLPVQVIE